MITVKYFLFHYQPLMSDTNNLYGKSIPLRTTHTSRYAILFDTQSHILDANKVHDKGKVLPLPLVAIFFKTGHVV